MKLESARELKQEIMDSLLLPILERAEGRVASSSLISTRAMPLKQALGPFRGLCMGIALKGKGNFKLALRIQSRSVEESDLVNAVRKKANGEIDVRYVGRIVKLGNTVKGVLSRRRTAKRRTSATPWYRDRKRPLLIGGSVGHYNITAGTLGGFVVNRSGTKNPMILSNNHVLADENAGVAGDSILQPGPYDRARKVEDKVGELTRFVPLRRGRINRVDSAVATLNTGIRHDASQIKGVGALRGVAPDGQLDVGDLVMKAGRTTGVTTGRVTAIELDNVVVGYDLGNVRFDNQIEIEGTGSSSFSDGGDSGSLIVNGEAFAEAQLFAGGDQGGSNGKGLTYATPIRAVLDALKVDLIH